MAGVPFPQLGTTIPSLIVKYAHTRYKIATAVLRPDLAFVTIATRCCEMWQWMREWRVAMRHRLKFVCLDHLNFFATVSRSKGL